MIKCDLCDKEIDLENEPELTVTIEGKTFAIAIDTVEVEGKKKAKGKLATEICYECGQKIAKQALASV